MSKYATKEQLISIVQDMASKISVPTIGIGGRVVEVRHAVARAVVQKIAKKDDFVVAQRLCGRERRLKRGRNAMNVA